MSKFSQPKSCVFHVNSVISEYIYMDISNLIIDLILNKKYYD